MQGGEQYQDNEEDVEDVALDDESPYSDEKDHK